MLGNSCVQRIPTSSFFNQLSVFDIREKQETRIKKRDLILLLLVSWLSLLGFSHPTPIFAIEMKNNAAILTFSLPAQELHLLHRLHHSS
jgi:hypothetical protein